MRSRLFAAVVVCLVVQAPVYAQDQQKSTFGEAAAQVDFPVFKPHRTLGLNARVSTVANSCVPSGDKRMVIAQYGRKSGSGPQFLIYEAKPFVCGDPGESRPYRKVRIRHRRVLARVFCESPEPECKLHKGRSHGFVVQLRIRSGKHHRLTAIGLESNNVPFRAFVRMARSLRRVKPVETTPPATVHLTSFLSDDGKVWCGINANDGYRWCTTDWPDQHGARLFADGTVVLCGLGQPQANSECANNWDPNAPVLHDGQTSDVGGYACTDSQGAITCTIKTGQGFRVDVGVRKRSARRWTDHRPGTHPLSGR
jgi:hypothetical protein